MAIRNISYFEVGDDYSCDGRGNDYRIIGCFSSDFVAQKYSEGRGNYGAKASVRAKNLIIVDTIEELEKADKVAKINAALAKLTNEEKSLLGL